MQLAVPTFTYIYTMHGDGLLILLRNYQTSIVRKISYRFYHILRNFRGKYVKDVDKKQIETKNEHSKDEQNVERAAEKIRGFSWQGDWWHPLV